jgi:hypothetical protein
MGQTTPLGVRVDQDTKNALKRAADDDDRSQASMIERILKEWLREHGYLQPAAKKAAGKRK